MKKTLKTYSLKTVVKAYTKSALSVLMLLFLVITNNKIYIIFNNQCENKRYQFKKMLHNEK